MTPTTEQQLRAAKLTYFIGNANGRGLIRIEVDGTGEHIASMPRGKKSEDYAAALVRAYNRAESLESSLVEMIALLKHPDDDGVQAIVDRAIETLEATS